MYLSSFYKFSNVLVFDICLSDTDSKNLPEPYFDLKNLSCFIIFSFFKVCCCFHVQYKCLQCILEDLENLICTFLTQKCLFVRSPGAELLYFLLQTINRMNTITGVQRRKMPPLWRFWIETIGGQSYEILETIVKGFKISNPWKQEGGSFREKSWHANPIEVTQ